MNVISVIILCLVLAACASGPQTPPRIAQGISENQRGLAQLAKGEDAKALAHFQQALSIAESLEDLGAMATNLLNIARTERRLGQPHAAKASLNRLLYARTPTFPRKLRLEAAYEATTLALDMNDQPAARAYLHLGEGLCGSNCHYYGQLMSLRAHLALMDGNTKGAHRDALTAVRVLREDNSPEHLALLAERQPGQAPALLQEALLLDKKRGASRAIFKDLLVLGQAWESRQQPANARDFYRRALNVARADGYEIGISQAKEALAGIR